MKGRNKLLIGVAVLLLVVLGVVVTGRREPSYGGKKLSYWVLKAAEENFNKTPVGSRPRYQVSPEVEAAILAIGTNGIPYYLKWLPYEPNGLTRVQMHVAGKSRKWFKHRWYPNNDVMIRSFGATIGLNLLGESAESAIPTLV